jgi:microcystin-dependent protein
MPYIVNYTDRNNKSPLTVFDNTSSTDTSLTFPGRNVAGYGQLIAENFLALLENFASTDQPVNPTEGQLWYDTSDKILKIYDGGVWKAASSIQKGAVEPPTETSSVGELWVDTTNQQLRIYTGNRWILVGPTESTIDGLRYGPVVESLSDSDNNNRSILVFYIADIPIQIISKDTFTPKIIIEGFDIIRTGINLTNRAVEGIFSKFYGTASSADSLVVAGTNVPAGRFLRSDITNTVEQNFNIRGSGGLTLGPDNNFNISTTSTAAKIYNSTSGSSIDLQINRAGIPNTILRILDDNVGINKAVPDEALDVVGNIQTTGIVNITNIADSTNSLNGALRVAGGVGINKNLIIGQDLDVSGTTQVRNLLPKTTDTFNVGSLSKRWNTVRAKTVIADEIQGVLQGNISGNANTATNLKDVTTFRIAGDITAPAIQFDGQIGSYTKIFNTTLTANIISGKSEPFPNRSQAQDQILVYRPSLSTPSISTEFRIIQIDVDYTSVTDVNHNLNIGDLFTPNVSANGLTAGGSYYVIAVPSSTRFRISVFSGGAVLPLAAGTSLNIPGRKGSATAGLIKESRDTFIGDLGVPIGSILPFAGQNVPYGYLLCDGSEIEQVKYLDLYDTIGNIYGTASIGFGTFKLPDLRGRFPLGRDNMDNNLTVPTGAGIIVDAGGGNADRVNDTNADNVGGNAGQSSVTLTLGNLPDHSHNMIVNNIQYSAVRIDTTINAPGRTGLGPTAPGQAQYLDESGPIKKPSSDFTLSTPIGIMNPYLTINYIIRSGPPRF